MALFPPITEVQVYDIQEIEKGFPFAKLLTEKGPVVLRSPVSGNVAELNDFSAGGLEILQKDPYGDGFLVRVVPAKPDNEVGNLIRGDAVAPWAERELEAITQGAHTFKIILVGEASVGKTAMKVRFTDRYFRRDLKSTLGIDFGSRVIRMDYSPEDPFMSGGRQLKVKCNVWDFGGQRIYESHRKLYYDGADGCLMVFDVTNPASLVALSKWAEEVHEHAGRVPMLFVGNKTDLKDEREVSREEGVEFAKEYESPYAECSALDGTGVEEAFRSIALRIYESQMKRRTHG